jgi:hypothetical protein
VINPSTYLDNIKPTVQIPIVFQCTELLSIFKSHCRDFHAVELCLAREYR